MRGSSVVEPQPAEHQEDAYQRHKTKLGEQEGGYHGNAPADDGEMRALYWILGLMELSAVERDTTRRWVVMEWASKAQLYPALTRFRCSTLHQGVVREHISDAHLAFDLVKTHPLCHTWSPFRYVCEYS